MKSEDDGDFGHHRLAVSLATPTGLRHAASAITQVLHEAFGLQAQAPLYLVFDDPRDFDVSHD